MLDEILSRMLARNPQDRYQTVSELIVDLERSRLAARVPEYADPEKALKDPWVRARLSSPAQQTRPDLEVCEPVPLNGTPVAADGPVEDLWLLRYRNRSGRLCKARLRTAEVLDRLRAGRLPAGVEAKRAPSGQFHSLRSFTEFAGVVSVKPARSRRAAVNSESHVRRWLLTGLAVSSMVVLGFTIYFLSK
jgi:hypothetical protein